MDPVKKVNESEIEAIMQTLHDWCIANDVEHIDVSVYPLNETLKGIASYKVRGSMVADIPYLG